MVHRCLAYVRIQPHIRPDSRGRPMSSSSSKSAIHFRGRYRKPTPGGRGRTANGRAPPRCRRQRGTGRAVACHALRTAGIGRTAAPRRRVHLGVGCHVWPDADDRLSRRPEPARSARRQRRRGAVIVLPPPQGPSRAGLASRPAGRARRGSTPAAPAGFLVHRCSAGAVGTGTSSGWLSQPASGAPRQRVSPSHG